MSDNIDKDKNNENLDPPLIVHKVTDASYKETESNLELEKTHLEQETATLERHRFKRKKKNGSSAGIIIFILIIIIGIFCYLYFSGALTQSGTKEKQTKAENSITSVEDRYKNTITVKDTYLFFEGKEVNGIEGLTSEVKYLDPGTKITVQDEHADASFLENSVVPVLKKYKVNYQIKVIVSSGLTSRYETTTASTTKEAATAAPKAEKTTKK